MYILRNHHHQWRNNLSEPQLSLDCSVRLHLIFTSLDFARVNFFYRARLSALQPTPKLEDQVSVFMSPTDRVAQFCLQALGYSFVTCDLEGYGGGILIHLNMGYT
jgi:hypothetical protein